VVTEVLDNGMVNVQFNGIINTGPNIITMPTTKIENKMLNDVLLIEGTKKAIKELEQQNKLDTNKTIIERRLDAI